MKNSRYQVHCAPAGEGDFDEGLPCTYERGLPTTLLHVGVVFLCVPHGPPARLPQLFQCPRSWSPRITPAVLLLLNIPGPQSSHQLKTIRASPLSTFIVIPDLLTIWDIRNADACQNTANSPETPETARSMQKNIVCFSAGLETLIHAAAIPGRHLSCSALESAGMSKQRCPCSDSVLTPPSSTRDVLAKRPSISILCLHLSTELSAMYHCTLYSGIQPLFV